MQLGEAWFPDEIQPLNSTGVAITVGASAFGTVMGVILVVGILTDAKLRKPTAGLLTMALVISDGLDALANVVIGSVVLHRGYFPREEGLCFFSGWEVHTLKVNSFCIMGLIAVDKYMLLVKNRPLRKRTVVLILLLFFSVSCLLGLCPILGFGTYGLSNELHCFMDVPNRASHELAYLVLAASTIFVTMIVVSIVYYRIFANVVSTVRKAASGGGSKGGARKKSAAVAQRKEVGRKRSMSERFTRGILAPMRLMQRAPAQKSEEMALERKMLRITLMMTVIFVVLWTPSFLMFMLRVINVGMPRWQIFYSAFLANFSSNVNPVIYGLGNKKYGEAMKRVARALVPCHEQLAACCSGTAAAVCRSRAIRPLPAGAG